MPPGPWRGACTRGTGRLRTQGRCQLRGKWMDRSPHRVAGRLAGLDGGLLERHGAGTDPGCSCCADGCCFERAAPGAGAAAVRGASFRGGERDESPDASQDRPGAHALLRGASVEEPRHLLQHVPSPRRIRRRWRADIARPQGKARRAQLAHRLQRGLPRRPVLGRAGCGRGGAGPGADPEPGGDGDAERGLRPRGASDDSGLRAPVPRGISRRRGSGRLRQCRARDRGVRAATGDSLALRRLPRGRHEGPRGRRAPRPLRLHRRGLSHLPHGTDPGWRDVPEARPGAPLRDGGPRSPCGYEAGGRPLRVQGSVPSQRCGDRALLPRRKHPVPG